MGKKIIPTNDTIKTTSEKRSVAFTLDHQEVEIDIPYLPGTNILAEEIMIGGIPCKKGTELTSDSVTFTCTVPKDVTLGILYGKKSVHIPKDSKIQVCNGWVTMIESPKPIKYGTVTGDRLDFDIDTITNQEPMGLLGAHITEESTFCGLVLKKDTDFEFNNDSFDRYYMPIKNIDARGTNFTVYTSGIFTGTLAKDSRYVGKKIISQDKEVSLVLQKTRGDWFYFSPERMEEFGFIQVDPIMEIFDENIIPTDVGMGPKRSRGH